MPPSSPTEAPAAFSCDCGVSMRSACKGLPFFGENESKRYCVLHYPSRDKVPAFNEALNRKVDARDFNFRGVWFPDNVDFVNAAFDTRADFESTTFSRKADFSLATFRAEANFTSATFGAAASFGAANFRAVAYFGGVTFTSEVTFSSAAFSTEAHFTFATFNSYSRFVGDVDETVFHGESLVNLQFVRAEKPDRLSFHTLTLRPHWFVNVDARKFEFINVDWNWRDISARQELERLGPRGGSSAHRLLAIACRNLAVNAEENHRYEEASRFRYMAMDARRLDGWQGWRDIGSWILHRLYWLASGYGERTEQAFLILLIIWLLSAFLYTQVGFVRWEPRVSSESEAASVKRDEVGEPLRWQRALTYSLGVMTLQKPEPRPATNAAQGLVMLETILGPVQAALLALAIRRKFMR